MLTCTLPKGGAVFISRATGKHNSRGLTGETSGGQPVSDVYVQAVFKPEAVPAAAMPKGTESESASVSTGPEPSKNRHATENSVSAIHTAKQD